MATTIRPVRVNHMNVVVEDFDKSMQHVQDLYGAEFVVDLPQKEMHAGLFEMGRVIFEIFAPHEYLLNSRYGPHYLGIEYQADMDMVRAAIAERGMRTVRDIVHAVHTHPQDAFGVSFEFYSGYFHDRDWERLGGPIKKAEYWRDEHPIGLTGQKAYTVAVYDIDAARDFFQSFLGGELVYEEARPAIAGRAVGLKIADAVMELVTPTGEGLLREHLRQHNQGIRSTVFRVRSLDQARSYFSGRGVALAEGSAPNSFAIPPEANLGLLFEFSE
jgi:catechol 2,3-dioxygenase-like lactoylglutathione lyase family enzyme